MRRTAEEMMHAMDSGGTFRAAVGSTAANELLVVKEANTVY